MEPKLVEKGDSGIVKTILRVNQRQVPERRNDQQTFILVYSQRQVPERKTGQQTRL